jgi:hypothetical protein
MTANPAVLTTAFPAMSSKLIPSNAKSHFTAAPAFLLRTFMTFNPTVSAVWNHKNSLQSNALEGIILLIL